jgi:hypothetical protein
MNARKDAAAFLAMPTGCCDPALCCREQMGGEDQGMQRELIHLAEKRKSGPHRLVQLYAHDAQATTRRTIGRTGPDEEFADQLGSQPAHRRIEEGDMSAIAARSPDDTGSESPAADAAHAIVEACDVLGLSAVVGLLAWPTMPQETKAAPTGSVVLTDDWLGPCGSSAV